MKHIVFDCDGTLLDTKVSKYVLFSGIKDLVKELAQSNLLYVWTLRDRGSTLRILQELGIFQYFDSFWTADDGFPKPHNSGLVSMLGEAPKYSICVIGDTPNDILGAKSFGVMSIGAIWNGETNPQILKQAGADFIVSHPLECSRLIQLNLKAES